MFCLTPECLASQLRLPSFTSPLGPTLATPASPRLVDDPNQPSPRLPMTQGSSNKSPHARTKSVPPRLKRLQSSSSMSPHASQ
ncbi:hypothetical protein E2C01_037927 [Portunus trituberculatus]|uniref:Uncharacterized protein n=1 Tax=Portunus trituberculatus TaxID=210409 RepID=A0A5B7FH56_PORTR|nr:hypothetical protein [Portunus trituberculatus]